MKRTEKVKHRKRKKREERKEKTPQSKECFWMTRWELCGGFFFFFFSLQKCKFSVEGGLFRTRCRALEHGFDNLQGGLSIAQIDVRLK